MKHFPQLLYMAFLCFVLVFSSCGSMRKASRAKEETKADGSNKKRDKELIEKYELLIGIGIDETKSLKLYKTIDSWMGVPYKYACNTKQGTDCSGFAGNIYKEVYDIVLPRSTEDQFHKLKEVKQKNLEEGNLVFFRIEKGKKVSHVGIYLGNNKFVHASTSKGVRIDDLTDAYYSKCYRAGGTVAP